MRITVKVLPALFMLFLNTAALAQESSVVIPQSNVPIKIFSYKAQFEEESRGNHPDQILHTMVYTNMANKDIVAVKFGLVSFDAFNGLLDWSNGWALDRLNERRVLPMMSAWAQRPYEAFTFKGYGTGVAFVNAVRFADGSIWRANFNEVLIELQKFKKDLKPDDLKVPKMLPAVP